MCQHVAESECQQMRFTLVSKVQSGPLNSTSKIHGFFVMKSDG